MKKRTYKRIQNRLYREIKRRMIAEQAVRVPLKVNVEERKIQTFGICRIIDKLMIQQDIPGYTKQIQREMAHELCDKMLDVGFIQFLTKDYYDCPLSSYIEIMARIDAVEPRMIWR